MPPIRRNISFSIVPERVAMEHSRPCCRSSSQTRPAAMPLARLLTPRDYMKRHLWPRRIDNVWPLRLWSTVQLTANQRPARFA
jgi:hypothetical protein